jgi:prepilin-type N-terminal cleavage/methylation domain-containing protein
MTKFTRKGFTIIEVLIVLAIAALIMLIVFLAVPALQRNNRNTQRNNDIAGILGGMSEFVNNNNGQLPGSGSFASEDNGTTLAIGASNQNVVRVNLGYYEASAVDLNGTAAVTEESVNIRTSATCDGTAVTTTGAPSRGYVAAYMLERDSLQCRES